MAASDADLIALSMSDPFRFAGVFDRHIDAVRRYVYRRLGARGDDVVSEVFRVAFEQRSRFRPEAESALPWLYGIAANLVRREHRNTARGIAALERLGHRLAPNIDPLHDAVARLDAANALDGLRDALSELREEERDVLLLVAWEELSPAEAAEVLGIDATTARTRLHRARHNIRRSVEHARSSQEEASNAN